MSQTSARLVRRSGERAAGICLVLTFFIGIIGLFMPTHDYAGTGDAQLEAMVSADALLTATVLVAAATAIGVLLVMTYAVWRSRTVWLAAGVLALCSYNLARCLAYYYLSPDLIHRYG